MTPLEAATFERRKRDTLSLAILRALGALEKGQASKAAAILRIAISQDR